MSPYRQAQQNHTENRSTQLKYNMESFWNDRYKIKEFAYGKNPNVF
ncbi:hypothetical protein OS188_09080 [Xanthomarina sp. F1114]|nr:hypothetical protein [Xanthomarina sp. F1114]MCX7548104.1 hypothetical protein [Xanthomarina sp. F1114]